MKETKKSMKKSTKTLFTICIVCLVLGIGCATIGLLNGPSSWGYWNGKRVLTSNSVGTYEEKKSLDPFTSVEIGIPTIKCTITEGEGYAISYTSCWPGIKPKLKLENGKLFLTAEVAESAGAIQLNGNTGVIEKMNTINVTVPKGTKLDTVEFSQHPDWDYTADISDYYDIGLNGIKVKELKSETGTYNHPVSIQNCEIDQIKLDKMVGVNMANLVAGKVDITLSSSGNWGSQLITVHKSTVNELVVNHPDYDKAQLINPANLSTWKGSYQDYRLELKDSVFSSLDIISTNILLRNITSAKTTAIAQSQLTVEGGSLKGQTVLRSGGGMQVNLPEKMTEFGGLLAVGPGYQEGIITELAEFGTAAYNYGFVTEESKNGGTRQVGLTQNEYNYLSGRSYQYKENIQENNDNEYDTTAAGVGTDEYSKFKDFLELKQEFNEDGGEYYAQVYNQKVVRYYLDQNGNPVYVSDNTTKPATMKINGDTQIAPRMSLTNKPGNQLDFYSKNSAEFNFGL